MVLSQHHASDDGYLPSPPGDGERQRGPAPRPSRSASPRCCSCGRLKLAEDLSVLDHPSGRGVLTIEPRFTGRGVRHVRASTPPLRQLPRWRSSGGAPAASRRRGRVAGRIRRSRRDLHRGRMRLSWRRHVTRRYRAARFGLDCQRGRPPRLGREACAAEAAGLGREPGASSSRPGVAELGVRRRDVDAAWADGRCTCCTTPGPAAPGWATTTPSPAPGPTVGSSRAEGGSTALSPPGRRVASAHHRVPRPPTSAGPGPLSQPGRACASSRPRSSPTS